MLAISPWVPRFLGLAGMVLGLLAAADKLLGLIQMPLHLATGSFLSLMALLVWSCWVGIPPLGGSGAHTAEFIPLDPADEPAPLTRRTSRFTAVLLLQCLLGMYLLAWKVSADPTPVLVQSELARGDQALNGGDATGALLVYREALERNPRLPAVLVRMGAGSYAAGNYEKARKYYEQAVASGRVGQRTKAYLGLGQSLWMLGQPEEAITAYRAAESEGLPPRKRSEWNYLMGWAHFDLRQYPEAVRHYREVGAAGGEFAAASYYNAACALAQQAVNADPAERRLLAEEAAHALDEAWKSLQTTEDREQLRDGLRTDSELDPLRGDRSFRDAVRRLLEIPRAERSSSG